MQEKLRIQWIGAKIVHSVGCSQSKIMRKQYIFFIFIILSTASQVFSINNSPKDSPHSGITSSGLNTIVSKEGVTFNITGGTVNRDNLFHSFGAFNLNSGERAIFNDSGIQNTIGRITGGSHSWIDGSIQSQAENLYLINPEGFFFGPNASLDLKGSFHVTTADYLRMDNGDQFSAIPVDNELLSSASPEAFGFLDSDIAQITIEGNINHTGIGFSRFILPDDKKLSLVGGNISLKSAFLLAPAGDIHIYSVLSKGEVVKSESGMSVVADTKGMITISDQSIIDLSGDHAGSLYIEADSFDMNQSIVYSDTLSDQNGGAIDILANRISIKNTSEIVSITLGTGKACDINIRATEEIQFSCIQDDVNRNFLNNIIQTSSNDLSSNAGDAGNIWIAARNISSINTLIASHTMSTGRSGDITIKASGLARFETDQLLSGNYSPGFYSLENKSFSTGKAGNILIDAQNISFNLCNGISMTSILPNTYGNIQVNASESINFSHARILSINGGNVDLSSKNINFNQGALIVSGTESENDGGNISLKAEQTVLFQGTHGIGYEYEDILFMLQWNSSGIGLYSRLLDESAGDTGNLLIDANQVFFKDGAHIISETKGPGNGGELVIKANDSITFSGEVSDGVNGWGSGIATRNYDMGQSASLVLEAKTISFLDGAFILSQSDGKGTLGNISLSGTERIHFSGHSQYNHSSKYGEYVKKGFGSSGIALISNYQGLAAINQESKLSLSAKNIVFDETASILSSTDGSHHASDIHIDALESVKFSGTSREKFGSSGISLVTRSMNELAGSGGDLWIDAEDIQFIDGSFISANTYGNGTGGNVTLNAKNTVTFSGDSGQRWKDSEQLILSIENNTKWNDLYEGKWHWMDNFIFFNMGVLNPEDMRSKEGNLLFPTTIFLESHGRGDHAGNAGTLSINAKNIYFQNGGGIACSTKGKGNAAMVNLFAEESIQFTGKGSEPGLSSNLYAEVDSESNGGDGNLINIQANDLLLADGAKFISTAFGPGRGGDISINLKNTLTVQGADTKGWSSMIASGSVTKHAGAITGDGGDINIIAGELMLLNGGNIASSTIAIEGSKSGNAGCININLIDSGSISGVNPYGENEDGFGSGIYARTIGLGSTGDGGKIDIHSRQFQILDGGVISTDTNNDALAGAIEIDVDEHITISGDSSGIQLLEPAEAQIEFQEKFIKREYYYISGLFSHSNSRKYDAGLGGTISLKADRLSLSNKGLVCASSYGGGDAGKVYLDVNYLDLNSESQIISGNDYEMNIYSFETNHDRDNYFAEAHDFSLQTGYISKIHDDIFIYSEKTNEWIPFQNMYHKASMDILNAIKAEKGDIVNITDTGNGNSGTFLYSGNEWLVCKGFGGAAGTINILAKDIHLVNSLISTSSYGIGIAGDIDISNATHLSLNNASISSESLSSILGGPAGKINISIHNEIKVFNNSVLTTEAKSAGGGQIRINAKEMGSVLKLFNGSITTNVKDGRGNGGDINIGIKQLALNHSQISANAIEGDGGAIFIVSEMFLKSTDTSIEASSERGNDGTVKIDAPDIDISSDLVPMTSQFLDAEKWMKTPCEDRSSAESSKLTVKDRDVITAPFYDYRRSPPPDIY